MNKNISGEPLWQPLPGWLATCQTKFHPQTGCAWGKGEEIKMYSLKFGYKYKKLAKFYSSAQSAGGKTNK